jgi:Protein of unknown function (DUF5818)
MKGIALTVATLGLVYATVALPTASTKTFTAVHRPAGSFAVQDQSNPQQPQAKTFSGTINKSGDQFVLSDEAAGSSYKLDDQQTASKYEGKKVKVTGTLDVANNLIHVQAIEEAAAAS